MRRSASRRIPFTRTPFRGRALGGGLQEEAPVTRINWERHADAKRKDEEGRIGQPYNRNPL
jgi:hypothetical protein